jgi:hypothetical protein
MRGLTPFIVMIAFLSLTGCERYALDRKMEELCKEDGGVKVYEMVALPAHEFSPEGQPLFQHHTDRAPPEDRLGPDYRYVQRREILVGKSADIEKGEGQLSRWYEAVYRRSDGRLLGESVSYGRGGGDGFTFGFQPSGNYCPRPRVDLAKSIFLRER